MPWANLTDSRCYYEIIADGAGSREAVLLIPGLGADLPGLG